MSRFKLLVEYFDTNGELVLDDVFVEAAAPEGAVELLRADPDDWLDDMKPGTEDEVEVLEVKEA